jgi:hypothetical protein
VETVKQLKLLFGEKGSTDKLCAMPVGSFTNSMALIGLPL